MHDDNQTYVPASFFALFQDARGRLTAPKALIAERHEFCEDMANALSESCLTVRPDGRDEERAVLERCHDALRSAPTSLEAGQARWVVTRTAELLGWDVALPADPSGPPEPPAP